MGVIAKVVHEGKYSLKFSFSHCYNLEQFLTKTNKKSQGLQTSIFMV